MTPSDLTRLDAQLHRLQLHYIQNHYQALATKAAEQQRSYLDYLEQLVEGEATMRENRSIERRIKHVRFPVLKSLDDFQWNWPKKINRPQIQNLFRLAFIATRPRQNAFVDRSRPRRLPEWTLGALHHRRGHYQHPGSGPVRRPSQARVPPLPEARRTDCR